VGNSSGTHVKELPLTLAQGAMKKTSQSKRSDGGEYNTTMNQGNTRELNQGNTHLKGKLQILEEDINGVASDMNTHKKELIFLKTGKDNLQDELKAKNIQVKSELAAELNKVEEQMKTHFSHQKAENTKLQQQITHLKNEKTSLQNLLHTLQRKVADLEMQVGTDDQK